MAYVLCVKYSMLLLVMCCYFVRSLKEWRFTDFWVIIKKFREDFIELALMIFKRFKIEEFELFVVMCWAIWTDL